jgi:hypothetical protein
MKNPRNELAWAFEMRSVCVAYFAPGIVNWKCDSGSATTRAISGPLSSGSMIEIAHRIPECDGAASYAIIRDRDTAVKIPTGLYT